MQEVITRLEQTQKKSHLPDVKSGDTVRVHQKIREGKKERVQIFEGTVIRRRRFNSVSATVTVRRLTAGIGIEKTYFLHSPNIMKIEITKRGKVRRNYLTYLRARQGKATRLQSIEFDKQAANKQTDLATPTAAAKTEVTKTQTPAPEAQPPQPETKAADDQSASKAEEDKKTAKKAKAEAFRQKHQ